MVVGMIDDPRPLLQLGLRRGDRAHRHAGAAPQHRVLFEQQYARPRGGGLDGGGEAEPPPPTTTMSKLSSAAAIACLPP